MRSLLESILDDEDILTRDIKQHANDEAQKQIIINGLLSNNMDEQESAIAQISDILKNEKRLKNCGKLANADTNTWYVKLPQYKGYSDDILFGHRVGSNHWVYRMLYDKTYNNKLFNCENSTIMDNTISVSQNENESAIASYEQIEEDDEQNYFDI